MTIIDGVVIISTLVLLLVLTCLAPIMYAIYEWKLKKTNDIKSCQDKSKGYVIERYNDFLDETQFLDKNDYWTSFLTEAKVFYSENEAKEYWDNCRVSRHGFKVYFRCY